MDFRVIAFLVVAGVAAILMVPDGPTVEERQTGHLKSAVAGVVARAALAGDVRLAITEPPTVKITPVVEKPVKRQARVLIASPTWACPYCVQQKPKVEALAARGWTVGKSSDDDFQFVTLADDEARKLYGVTRWPATIYLDSSGKVVSKSIGVQQTATLEAGLKALRK